MCIRLLDILYDRVSHPCQHHGVILYLYLKIWGIWSSLGLGSVPSIYPSFHLAFKQVTIVWLQLRNFFAVKWTEVRAKPYCSPISSRYCLDFRFGILEEPNNNFLDDLGEPEVGEFSLELELDDEAILLARINRKKNDQEFKNISPGIWWLRHHDKMSNSLKLSIWTMNIANRNNVALWSWIQNCFSF